MVPRFLFVVGCSLLLTTTALRADELPSAADLEFFEKQVRPVLVEHCHKCHGPDQQKAGLRLDSRAAVVQGGESGASIVLGKPDESLLVEAIRYGADGYQMPPDGKLADEQIAALTEWVKRGAPWPADTANGPLVASGFNLEERAKHWSFQPVTNPAIPAVEDVAWPRTSIDPFILRKLESAELKPAAEADKRVLIRRLTFERTGLPPTPEEIDAFLADEAPDAYERLVDRLLASPHYGERWGRHWLDLVRFAETYGHEFDFNIPHAQPYRDYAVRALNEDLPYDQFVTEHVAGDLLKAPRRDRATGYNESVQGTAFYWFSQAKHSPVDIRADECDTVDLNTVECEMLDSMMKQAESRPLTPKQRAWLSRILDERGPNDGDSDE